MPGEQESSEPPPAGAEDPLAALPGLARIAASAAWHTGNWALGRSLHLSRRLAAAAISPEEAAALARDARRTAVELLDELIEVSDMARNHGAPAHGRAVEEHRGHKRHGPQAHDRPHERHRHAAQRSANGQDPTRSLRAEGEELLRRSRDVHYEVDAHPAYERILSELAPDEARVLRLLLLDGPQPAVDVRTGGPLGLVHSRLIAPGISMIGARAGCRYVERVPSYLNNLFRLGLIWFSRETLRDHQRYQVLEAQPEVLEAVHSVPYAKIVRRSIHLTPFGEDFCRMALAPEQAATAQLPAHSPPPQGRALAQPPPEGRAVAQPPPEGRALAQPLPEGRAVAQPQPQSGR
jgi:hypothetical protein